MYSVLNAQTCNMGESLFPSNFHLVMIRKRQKSYKCKRIKGKALVNSTI